MTRYTPAEAHILAVEFLCIPVIFNGQDILLLVYFRVKRCTRTQQELVYHAISKYVGLELAIDPPPPPPKGNFVHYDFLKLHYIRHKIKDVSPLRVAALTCNSTLYTLPPKIASNVSDNVSTMTCSYIFAC